MKNSVIQKLCNYLLEYEESRAADLTELDQSNKLGVKYIIVGDKKKITRTYRSVGVMLYKFQEHYFHAEKL